MLKEGTKNLSGVEEAVLKNIDAVKELAKITRTSLGPNGMNKMVINKIGKLFVTNDAATILKELEVIHPAAKMCVLASQQQQEEVGDATNLVVVLCGELLAQAEVLLKMGLHTSDIIRGYEKALELVDDILKKITVKTVESLASPSDISAAIKSAISAKQHGFEDLFAPLVTEACLLVTTGLPHDPREAPPERYSLKNFDAKRFNVDNVRVAKVLGGGISDVKVIRGAIVTRDTEGTIKSLKKAKVGVYASGLEIEKTDTKGKVYVEKASQLENYAKSEEEALEAKIKSIAESGVTLVVSGGNIGELPMHFLEKYKLMVLKTQSKFEMRRVCQVTNCKPMMRIAGPSAEEMGYIDECVVEEIGGTVVTVLRQENSKTGIATILVRAATNNILDDLERAIEAAVNIYKSITKDGAFVPGAGAAEIELARQIRAVGDKTEGQDQYAIKKFAEAFEIVPRILADNAGLDGTKVISTLFAQHESGNTNVGVDVQGGAALVVDAREKDILDHRHNKQRAIELATNAVITILRISQIIMAKTSGVPVPGGGGSGTMGAMDQDD
uniref:CCT-theta n=1 Tax=Arcella intermedia TaxID=1963864 RepID=A0A6B2L166_9EUKA